MSFNESQFDPTRRQEGEEVSEGDDLSTQENKGTHDEDLEQKIRERVLEMQKDELLEAFFRAYNGDTKEAEEEMIKWFKKIREFDQQHGTNEAEKLVGFLERMSDPVRRQVEEILALDEFRGGHLPEKKDRK